MPESPISESPISETAVVVADEADLRTEIVWPVHRTG